MWKKRFPLMNEAGTADAGGSGGGDPGAGGSAVNDQPAGGDAAAASTTQPAAAAAPAAQPTNLLKQGVEEAAPTEFIPEKYRVTKEDGTLDIEASARKLAEAHGSLEKRLGSGDAPPKAHTDYAITPPDDFKDIDFTDDAEMQEFLSEAHKAGYSQKQIDVALASYFKMAPLLAGAGAEATAEAAETALKQVWTTDADFKRNAGLAHVATAAAAEKAGISMDQAYAELGNNPTFLRLMAALGPEFQEDSTPGAASFKAVTEDDIRTMEMSEAYRDPKHKDHERVSATVKKFYDRRYGTEAAA